MSEPVFPIAMHAADAPPRKVLSFYPEPFASRMKGRDRRTLGEIFGLKNFGVNLTRLAPGAMSALRHSHLKQDEFVYILEGHPTLVTNEGKTPLGPGMCAGFRCGTGNAHHLVNESDADVLYLEIGDRSPGEEVDYPDDDLVLGLKDGRRAYVHKDGRPY